MAPTTENDTPMTNLRDVSQLALASKAAWSLALAVVIVSSLWCRHYILDDAFIHLRYAQHLDADEGLVFNDHEASFGTSAPAYTALLAAVGTALKREQWPIMAKCATLAFHLLCIPLLWFLCRKGTRILCPLLIAFMLFAPTSTRWLQDGMETSLAVLLSFASVAAISRSVEGPMTRGMPYWTGLAAAAPAMLRLDGLPTSLASLGLLIALRRSARVMTIQVIVWIAAVVGAMALTAVVAGHVVPDSAVAKTAGGPSIKWVWGVAVALASVSPLWLLAPVSLGVQALRAPGRPRLVAAAAIAPFTAVVAAGMLRGQFIHGARYFLPTLAYATGIWCWARVANMATQRDGRTGGVAALAVVAVTLGGGHAAATHAPLSRVLSPVQVSTTPDLERPGRRVMLHDFGRLAWLYPITVLDLAGLVCGRHVAELPSGQRPCGLVRAYGFPDVLVLTDQQAAALSGGFAARVLTLDCGGRSMTFVRGDSVMRAHNLRTALDWRIWRPGESGRNTACRQN